VPSSPTRWQATSSPADPTGRRAGTALAHSGTASGHRGWNRQPEGGAIGLGTSRGGLRHPAHERLIRELNRLVESLG
jgi:hypothetical protein